MADLIDRQAAIDVIMGQPPEPHYPDWYAEQIKKLPSVMPKRETGEWLANEHDDIPLGLMISCSKCGGELLINDAVNYDYCPYCGSFNQAVYNSKKMRGENESD